MLWIAAEPSVFLTDGFFSLRAQLVQYSGIIAIGCMAVAMILALRPRWPEAWCVGLLKADHLTQWLGHCALVTSYTCP
ncbi:ferric reductase, partial [Azospirillum brasilense]|nr:ferric reductase [Azospirillum brasilense]